MTPHQSLIDRLTEALEAPIDAYFQEVHQELVKASIGLMRENEDMDESKLTTIDILFLPLAPDVFDLLGMQGSEDVRRPLYDALVDERDNAANDAADDLGNGHADSAAFYQKQVAFLDELIAVFDRWRVRQAE